MKKQSAGILAFQLINNEFQFLLVHPGGPFCAKKEVGAWSIPKGELDTDENPLLQAKREFKEEIGQEIDGLFIPLTPITQKGGKTVKAWAVECSQQIQYIGSNTFEMEWPPKSGIRQQFPEVDKAEWFDYATAIQKINSAQIPFLDELIQLQTKRD